MVQKACLRMVQSKIWLLMGRKLSGEASLDELKELERLLQADPELAYQIDLYSRFFEKSDPAFRRTSAARQESLELFRQKLSLEMANDPAPQIQPDIAATSTRRLVNWKRWVSAAAIFALLTTSGIWIYNMRSKAPVSDITTQQVNEVNTMPGSRSKNVLPDGTIVWLNSDSRISYNAAFGKEKREITLTGEAFFDVARNEAVPLFVHAKTVTIEVKGTAFNVRSYPGSDKVQTALIRGSVELHTKSKPDEKIRLKPNEKITIDITEDAGRNAVNTASKTPPVKSYHIDVLKQSTLTTLIPEVSWIENRLVFDNEPLPDVIDKMEKWYNIDIVLTNKKLEGKKFSGVFEKENISEALSALQIINHFEYEVKGSTVIIK